MDKKSLGVLQELKKRIELEERQARGLTLGTFDFSKAAKNEAEKRKQRENRRTYPPEVYDPTKPTVLEDEKRERGRGSAARNKPVPGELLNKPVPEKKPKLTTAEKKRRRAEKVARQLRKDMEERRKMTATPFKEANPLSNQKSAFSNIYTTTSLYRGGAPGSGKKR